MNAIRSGTGLLLPFDTLALLGAGTQGTAAIRNYGFPTAPEFWDEFSRLEERLQASADDDASAQLAASRAIVAVAHDAVAWAAIRSDAADVPPALLLVGARAALVAVLHGQFVEYVVGGVGIVAQVVNSAVDATGSAQLTLTLFDEDVSFASARFVGGTVDIAARDSQRLARLAAAAEGGRGDLISELLSEMTMRDRSSSRPVDVRNAQ